LSAGSLGLRVDLQLFTSLQHAARITGRTRPGFPEVTGSISSGAPIMRPESQGLGWFRIYRDGPATFVITVGAGGTRGFKDWNEVVSGTWGDQSSLFGWQETFESMLSGEVRQWFRAEWSAAIGAIQPSREQKQNSHGNYTMKKYEFDTHKGQVYASRGNACGTFSYFQRLRYPPERW